MQISVNSKICRCNYCLERRLALGYCIGRKCCGVSGRKILYRLTKSLPYLLNRVGVQMGELFSRRIAGYGVTLPMYRVMAALWEQGDQRLGDLAAMTTIELSTLSRLVGEMKRRGLVSRARLKDNGRTVAINLAPKGRSLVEELMPIAMHFEEVAVRDFRATDILQLKAVLENIYQSLKSLEPEIEQANATRKAAS
jgi:MarR family transcriptional regulator, organic hydroperoxide resistance regulator